MLLRKCDRCGAFYEYIKGDKKNLIYQLKERVPDKLCDSRVIDLCPVCQEKLKNWYEKCED